MIRQIVTDDDELTVVDGLMHLLDMSLCVYQEVVGSQQFHQSIKRRIVVVVLVFAAATATSTMDSRGGEKSQDSNSSNS